MKEAEPLLVGQRLFFGLGTVLLVLVLLYFGKPVLLPVALGVLLAFILNPVVQVLEKWRLGRIPSVIVASSMAFLLIAMAMWALASQIQALASELPNHTDEIKNKIESFRASESSTIGRLTGMFRELFPSESGLEEAAREAATSSGIGEGNSVDSPEPASDNPGQPAATESGQPPAPVFVVREPIPAPATLETATAILLPVFEPLAMSALVIVLVIFLLVERENVRYRAISLMGDSALTGTTRLMRDAADRVSRYLLYLFGVNAAFGLWFGLGLYFLGVPYAPLWGFLTLCFRFIPFVGSPASVLFPLLISIATSSGWAQPVWVALFFSVSELLTANVIEPIVFGKTTGLTPIALLLAVLFWTWVWGPIGLLLSTPLTVCMVVLGQHIPHLRSLKVLLAEQPVLDARLQYFQRLIAGDAREAERVVASYVEETGNAGAFDNVLVPALRWTRRERAAENISAAEENFIHETTIAIVQEVLKSAAETPNIATTQDASGDPKQEDHSSSPESQPVAAKMKIYCHPVHHEFEEVAQLMLTGLLDSGCEPILSTTRSLPGKVVDEIETHNPDAVVLTIVPPGGIPQVKFLLNSIRARCPGVYVIVAFLSRPRDYDELLVQLRSDGATWLTTSLAQTASQIEQIRQGTVTDRTTHVAHSVTRRKHFPRKPQVEYTGEITPDVQPQSS